MDRIGPPKRPQRLGPPPRSQMRAPRSRRASLNEEPEEVPKKDIPRWKREARSFFFDILAAFIVLLILIGGLYTYTDNWPPLVVVQSGSMQHSDDTSYVGVIDTGDLVFVKRVDEVNDTIPYLDGTVKDHRTYDSFGDVIIFRPNGNTERTAIIHRAVMYVEFNGTDLDWNNGSYGGFDIPLTGEKNVKGNYIIEDYEWPEGIKNSGLVINFDKILESFYDFRKVPHGGFITKGDNNDGPDQTSHFDTDPPWIEPVKPEWVIGKSVGELPWFGIIKLRLEGNDNWPENSMRSLIIAMVVLVSIPFVLDFGIHFISRSIKGDDEEKEEKEKEVRPQRPSPDEKRGKTDLKRPPIRGR